MRKGKRSGSRGKQLKKEKKLGSGNLSPLPNPLYLEGTLSGFFGGSRRRSPVEEAPEVMYDAWEAPSSRQRIELARKALEISPDCADAYVLLAQEAARSLPEALDLYRQGIEAGERALDKKAFKEDVGHFLGILETRPYMRARAGLAQCLWELGHQEEAIQHYRALLELNPNDNQGIRDLLMPCLIEIGRDREAEALFNEYEDDAMAVWLYSRALLDFRKEGDSPTYQMSLAAALRENKHVPAYLLGRKKLPRFLPDHYGFGDENEAMLYVHENLKAWKSTSGALEWISAHTK